MNEVRVKFHIAVTKFYLSVMELLSRCFDEHLVKAGKALEELERCDA